MLHDGEKFEKQDWKLGHKEPLHGGMKGALSERSQAWAIVLSHVSSQKDSSFGEKSAVREGPQSLLRPWFQTSSLQGCEKINFCSLRHPACGSLL